MDGKELIRKTRGRDMQMMKWSIVEHGRKLKSCWSSCTERFGECGLELHPDKTRIVYCKDDDRRDEFPETKFDFLGYTFRPRRSKNRYGKFFINFTPAVSNKACKAMRQTIRQWRLQLKPDKELLDISRMFNPVLRGGSTTTDAFTNRRCIPSCDI